MLYFQQLPKITYSFDGAPPIVITNIMARARMKKVVEQNSVVMYTYQVKDTDTAEIIAHKYYGDTNRYWIIFLANNIINPYYDWPMSTDVLLKYVIGKYGSIATAQSTIHRYDKIVTRTDSFSGTEYTRYYEIDQTTYDALPTTDTEVVNLPNGGAVTVLTTKQIVYAFDYENDLNESKRTIKLIDASFVSQIESEFKDMFS